MKAQPLTFFLPDTRGVEISRYGLGNRKIGVNTHTYSRVAGNRDRAGNHYGGTCPGSTDECEEICYAKRIVGPVFENYLRNLGNDVPEIPVEAKRLRIHVSGDFNTVDYIWAWIARIQARPDVKVWAYTRSWRVPELVFALEKLRALPNMQLFASMDASTADTSPRGWRRAWIHRSFDSAIKHGLPMEDRLVPWMHNTDDHGDSEHNMIVVDGLATPAYVCPEETGRKADCEACRYCFDGRKHDVVFLEH